MSLSSPTPGTVVFDLDGTLIDTAPDLTATLNYVLVKHNVAPIPLERVRQLVGTGAAALIKKGISEDLPDFDEESLGALLEEFLTYYAENIAVHSRPFPNAINVVHRFRDQGFRLAVCTNKKEALSQRLLDELDLSKLFEVIAGPDTYGHQKPDPLHLIKTIEAAGGTKERAIMVGDSKTDIHAAQAAGVPVIAVDFGYTPAHVSTFDPDHVVSDFAEIPAIVSTYFG